MRSKVTRSCLPTNDVPNQYVRAVKNNGVSVGVSDMIQKKLLKLGAALISQRLIVVSDGILSKMPSP